MYPQVILVLGCIGAGLGYPRAYQEPFFYAQPYQTQQLFDAYQFPQQQRYQVPQQQRYQVPAATQLLPNNINSGVRYGQQHLVYVVPGGSQVFFEEQGGNGEQPSGGYLEAIMGLLPWGQKPTEKPTTPNQPAEKPTEAVTEKPTEIVESQENSQVSAEQLNQQQLQRFPLWGQQFVQQPYNRPAVAAPPANLIYNYRNYPQYYDRKLGNSVALQKLIQKAENTTDKEPTSEESPSSEEYGPSIAQAKPQAVSVAGVGGVAAAAPVGTAIVGPGGMALSAPTATAVAGTKPQKPNGDKTRAAYNLPRNTFYPNF